MAEPLIGPFNDEQAERFMNEVREYVQNKYFLALIKYKVQHMKGKIPPMQKLIETVEAEYIEALAKGANRKFNMMCDR
jgi:hypothetical protein